MKIKIFAIRDLAVGAFAPPFVARANGEAIRMFNEHLKKQVAPENRKDYILYKLGEYDDHDGRFYNDTKPAPLDTDINTAKMAEDINDGKTRNQ